MSVVIVGGNDRMIGLYKELCKRYGCRAKVFTQMKTEFEQKIGSPDLVILFTGTVSHTMTGCAVNAAKRFNIPIERSHSSSLAALRNILSCYCHGEGGYEQNI